MALLLLPAISLASDISSALFFGNIVISNNGTATGNISTNMTLNTDNLIADDFLNATANNTVIRNASGADVIFQPGFGGADWALWVPQIGANAFLTNILYTANSTGGEIRYFPDSGGMTISDNASMEISDNFSLSINGWIDTDTLDDLIVKEDTFNAWISATGNISASTVSINITAAEAAVGGNHLTGTDVVYLTAHDKAVANAAGGNLDIGQQLGFNIFRGVVYFDTSGIPDDVAISRAILNYRVTNDQSITDFNIIIQNGQPTYPSSPVVVTDYDEAFYSGNGGSFNTAGVVVGDNVIPLNNTGLGWINRAGTTKLMLRSDEDINSSEPAGNEFVQGTSANTFLRVFYFSPDVEATGITEGEYDLSVSIKDDPGLASYDSSVNIGVSMGSGILPVRILQKQTLAAPAASVTFSSISGNVSLWDSLAGVTSRHLVVMVNAASVDAVTARIVTFRYNGDAGVNYSNQTLLGTAAVASAAVATASTFRAMNIPGTTFANAFGGGTVLIPHAFNTTNHKSMISQWGSAENDTGVATGRWANTSAINSLFIFNSGTDFATGSTFILGVVDERYLVEEDLLAAPGTIDFNNISQDGHDLVIIGYPRSDVAAVEDEILHEINTDAVAANYPAQELLGRGAATSAASPVNQEIGISTGDNAGANEFGAFFASYSQYAEGTNDPHFLSLSGYHESSVPTSEVRVMSGRRNNIVAITRLEYYPNAGANFDTGTLFSLYRVPRFLIDRQELAAPAATITFNNIPQGYEALQLNVYARSDLVALVDVVKLTINTDAVAANYDWQRLRGAGVGIAALRSPASLTFMDIPAATEGANEYGGGIVTFNQYARTDGHKHYIKLNGRNENLVEIASHRWEDTSAITRIDLDLVAADNFIAGSVFELVGVMPTKSFMIEIDGDVEAIEAAGDASVIDNANDWIIGSDATPYIEQYEHRVGGNLLSDISWEYAAIFADASGNGNDATPTFRTASMDADVVATLTTFQPVSEAKAPDFTLADAIPFIEGTGNMTGNFTTGPTIPGTGFPLAGVIAAVAGATTPPQLPLMMIAVFVILAFSLGYSSVTRRFGSGSIFGKAFVIIAVMSIFAAIGNFGIDFWMIVTFAILVTALAMGSRQQSWQ